MGYKLNLTIITKSFDTKFFLTVAQNAGPDTSKSPTNNKSQKVDQKTLRLQKFTISSTANGDH